MGAILMEIGILSTGDAELLQAWRAGDRDAGDRLLRRHVRPLAKYVRDKVHCRQTARDIVQKTLLSAVEIRDRLPEDALRAFLFGIARNEVRMRARKRLRGEHAMRRAAVAPQTRTPSPSAMASASEQRERLLDALGGVRESDRRLLELYYWDELPLRSIAAELGTTTMSLKVRLFRLRRSLKGRMSDLAEPSS